MSGCLKFFAVAIVLGLGLLIWSASRPTDYHREAESFCASGVARLQPIIPTIQSRGVVATRTEERGATYTCAANALGRTHVVIVRARCGAVLDCAQPLAAADDRGEIVWSEPGVDLATLPGLVPRP